MMKKETVFATLVTILCHLNLTKCSCGDHQLECRRNETRLGESDLNFCYKELYSIAKERLVNEMEWKSYRDMIYVSLRLKPFLKSKNTVNIVFAKSVMFFLLDPVMLKSMTTPLLQLFGLVYASRMERIELSVDVPSCSNANMVLTMDQSVQNVVEFAAQRAVSAIEMGGKASSYVTVYNVDTMSSRQPVFLAFLCLTLVCLSIASAGLVGKHVHNLTNMILKYARLAHYHAFAVFCFVSGSVLTMLIWLVWLFIVFVRLNTWEGWVLLCTLVFHIICFIPAEIMAVKNMNFIQNRSWLTALTTLPLATSLIACIQFASFLVPFLLLSLLSWPLLTTASVLFAYSLSFFCYGAGIVVVFLAAVVTISGFYREHKNCFVGTLIITRDVVILGCAITAEMLATLILGYFLLILHNGTQQDPYSVLPLLLSSLGIFKSTLFTFLIHKILSTLKKPKASESNVEIPEAIPLVVSNNDEKAD